MLKNISLLMIVFFTSPTWAVLDIEITGGAVGEHPIAIVPFSWDVKTRGLSTDVSGILSSDLSRTGKFALADENKFPERPNHGDEVDFDKWRSLGVESLVVGRIRPGENGNYQIEFQLFDIYKRAENNGGPAEPAYKLKQIIGYSLPSSAKDLRRTAHYMSDLIYEALTGEKGIFTTRIAYVTVKSLAKKQKSYELQIADMDGHNPFTVLKSHEPIMSPSWSPDARQLAYVTFENKKSQVYIQQVDTGKRKLVSTLRGVNGSPAWSPDGKNLALTLSRDGNLEVYILNLATRKLSRVTRNSAIDTEAAWAPDSKSLAFVSDRSGRPQIYRVPAKGGRAERVTFLGNYNSRPAFSPDGKKMTMVHGNSEGYHIAILDLESGVVDVLTDGRLDESPTFAPNGSTILYATSSKKSGILSAVSSDGKVKQRLVLQQGDIREPAWAPYRK